ncbi:MAG: N-acetylmuramoyl-L-alanine amidase [Desulfobacterales bacterium]
MRHKKYYNIDNFHLLHLLKAISVVMLFLMFSIGARVHAAGVIVVDPGHGGTEKGTAGWNGRSEKEATLALSNTVKETLSETYVVFLTRTHDDDVALFDRTAAANHVKADAYISIHAGKTGVPGQSGVTIFYFDDIAGGKCSESKREFSGLQPDTEGSAPWDTIQNRHIARSRKLAGILEAQFDENGIPARVRSAPLLTLRGADMPAVFIEFSDIPLPDNGTDRSRPEHYAFIIRTALDRFFEQ